MFINASCVIGLGLEVGAFREAMCGCSSLGGRVRVDYPVRIVSYRSLKFCSWWTPGGGGGGGAIASSRVWVHGNIASSRVWVHGMVIHHSW